MPPHVRTDTVRTLRDGSQALLADTGDDVQDDNNDVRTETAYRGGTVHKVDVDKSSRPKRSRPHPQRALSPWRAPDGLQLRAGRSSYAVESKGSALNESWQHCYDLADNLTSQGTAKGSPRGTAYTVNDAQQIAARNRTARP